MKVTVLLRNEWHCNGFFRNLELQIPKDSTIVSLLPFSRDQVPNPTTDIF